MNTQTAHSEKLRVIVVGGGVAALETTLALHDLASELTDITLIAPNDHFHYRPMSVREPFALGAAQHYPLDAILRETNVKLISDELGFVDPDEQIVHTRADLEPAYDALVIAMGAKAHARYAHAITIDAAHMDEILHGTIQDVEQGYIKSLAFVVPGRMAWPLPLYELALMTAGRAYDMNIDLQVTLITPEDTPLAIFGQTASSAVAEILARSNVETIHSAYCEVPRSGEVVVNPGDRRLHVDRVIALPELYGPSVRGLPLGVNGFLQVNAHGRLMAADNVYAAGDCTEFPVKHGGVASQQADAVAESIAQRAGADVLPKLFHPVIRGMLLTAERPLYLTAKITGGYGFSSEITDHPTWSPPAKIAAKYLAPRLEALDHEPTPA